MSARDSADEARVRRLIADEPADRSDQDPFSWLRRMCRVAAREVPATGAGLSLISSDGSTGMAAASDPAAETIEELQFVLGEGPCVEARASRAPVLIGDLAAVPAGYLPTYAPAARGHGVEAVFAFPLQVGGACLGVLDLFRNRAGPLSPGAFDEASVFARVTLVRLLDDHEAAASSLLGGDVVPYQAFSYGLQVHQATGMVMAQLRVGAEEAMLRLRAHAYAQDRRLSLVADDIISRRLVLEPDDNEGQR